MDKTFFYSAIDAALTSWMATHGKHPLQSLIHSANRYAFDEAAPIIEPAQYLRCVFTRLGAILGENPALVLPKPPPQWATNTAAMIATMAPNPTVDQVLRFFLPLMGYSGLADGDGCGCRLDDMAPCRADISRCRAGYLQAPTDDLEEDQFTPPVFLSKQKAIDAAANKKDFSL